MKIVLFIGLILQIYAQREKGQELCYTTDEFLGACVVLSNCPSIAAVNEKSDSTTTREFMEKTKGKCNFRTFLGEPIVCCKEAYRGSRRGKGRKKGAATSVSSRENTTEPIRGTTYTPTIIQRISDDEETCRTPDKAEGTCRDLVQCSSLMVQLRERQNDPSFAQFLRMSNIACAMPPPTVCCPVDINPPELAKRLFTREDGCGQFSSSQDKIVGGTEADVGSYPWIALLGYEDLLGGNSFRCGGVLITASHVLTAAHCILKDLKFVRLGEHDLRSDSETFHVDIGISKVEAHPRYSRNDGHSDIGMIYLQKYAPLTKLIRPICLPQRFVSYIDVRAFVAGWGKTMEGGATSDVLQEIRIPILQNSVCNNSYARLRRLISTKQFDEAIICAGVMEGGIDTCQGDSGGPLMALETYNGKPIFTAVGIVSYSIGCARPNSPSVYASLPYFMDWIESKVADSSP